MASARKPKSVNHQLSYNTALTWNINEENATKSRQPKRKLTDLLGPQWSKEELQDFYRAYRKHGKDWEKISAAVDGRSVEMVEGLYNMNRAYLSLPKGHTSAAGLVAMMTVHYSILKDSDSEQETNEPLAAPPKPHKPEKPQKPQKHARGSEELGESPILDPVQSQPKPSKPLKPQNPEKPLKPKMRARASEELGKSPILYPVQPQSAASSYGRSSLVKKKRSDRSKNNRVRDATGRQAAGNAAPFSSNIVDMSQNMPSSAATPDVLPGSTTNTSHRLVQVRHPAVGSYSVCPPLPAAGTSRTAPHGPSVTSSCMPSAGPAQGVGSSFFNPPHPAADNSHTVPHGPSFTSSCMPSAEPAQASRVLTSESDIESDDCAEITLRGDVMLPSGSSSRRMRKIFQKRLDIEGSRWKTVSEETKDFYFAEFKKHFYWDQSIDAFVKIAWEKKAARRYSDLLNYVKNRENRPDFVPEAVWMQWQQFWSDPHIILLSARNSKNRQGRGDGDGAGHSSHTAGSVSYAEHGQRLEAKLGRKPTPHEFFLYTHTKNHDGKTFVDERSRQINDKIVALLQQMSQNSGTIDENKAYYEAVGGEQKRRVYGLGSEASQYYTDGINAYISIFNSRIDAYTNAIGQLEQRLASLQEAFNRCMVDRVQQQMSSLEQRMAELAQQMKSTQGEKTRKPKGKKNR